ncbi:class I SAM-dependent methyltransferase, partial [Candidatus Omnitrophota bacterium]
DHILEVGCTAGHISFILANMGYKVTAIDISSKSIEIAKQTKIIKCIDNIDFFASDAEDLSIFPDNHFDVAFSFSVLRYVPNPVMAIKEMRRVVKKGGVAVVDFPNKFCPWFKLLRRGMGLKEHIHDHLYSVNQVKKMFYDAGFSDVKAVTLLYVHKKMSNFIFNIAKPIGRVLEYIPFINNTAAIIMCRGVKN